MSVTKNLNYTKRQLRQFAVLFKRARLAAKMTQLQVAQAAFEYEVSHCKVSRVERCKMRLVDAHCLERMARVLHVPRKALAAIDYRFVERAQVIRSATVRGFWPKRSVRSVASTMGVAA